MDISFFVGNSLKILPTIQEGIAQTCVTSPPYFGLRDYGTAKWIGGDPECDHNPQRPDGGDRSDRTVPLGRGGIYKDHCLKCGAVREDEQLGIEETPEEYVESLVSVLREVKRVLRDDGTLWLNIGDSYNGNKKGNTNGVYSKGLEDKTKVHAKTDSFTKKLWDGAKPKDLIGIPWMVAFALRADGWYLRQDIIWAKPNPMTESVKDRCTKSHEYIFLLSKSNKYYFDYEAIQEKAISKVSDKSKIRFGGNKYGDNDDPKYATKSGNVYVPNGLRRKRDVWTVSTKPYTDAHFATFPEALIEPCILAGSKEGDIVIDPFNGAGTAGLVSKKLGRSYIGIDINQSYIDMSIERLKGV